MSIKVSAIIATLGRINEVNELINSFLLSSYKLHQIIIVDQNNDSSLDEIINLHSLTLKILHLKVPFKGVSKARNFGLSHLNSDYVTFIDDDAKIFPNTIAKAVQLIAEKKVGVLFGKCVDENLKDSVLNFHKKEDYLTLKKHNNMFVESTMFIKTDLIIKHKFDENLGAGTFHGAEEGYDLVLRLLKSNISIFYSPSIIFYHPQKILNYDTNIEIKRVFTYRCGFASVCKKHNLFGRWLGRLTKVSLALPILFIFRRKKFLYYTSEVLGLITGYIIK